MAWRKSPPELIAAFEAALPADPRAERRQMFGCPCGFVGGNMFAGVHQENVIVRLPADLRAELLRLPGAALFEPMPGRTMKEYVVVPASVRADAPALATWVARAFAHAAALPAKIPRSRGRREAPSPRRVRTAAGRGRASRRRGG